MANPSKAQDAASVALSAIEEALKVVDSASQEKQASAREANARTSGAGQQGKEKAREKSLPKASSSSGVKAEAAFEASSEGEPDTKTVDKRLEKRLEVTLATARPAANDDRPSVGQILLALQTRPSSHANLIASLASAAWLSLIGFYIWSADPATITHAQIALYALAALGPVAFFYSTAIVVRRTQEMRLTAQSMSQVAIRLAEPETLAAEQIVTLSQAIRREVASMGDGIERALARASELETVMRAEVASLERSYSDNERRIRSLIDELASEREAIVGNAEHLRSTIAFSQEKLSADLENASSRWSEVVGDAGSRVTTSLGAKAEEISLLLTRSGNDMVERIEANAALMTVRFAETGTDVSELLGATLLERVDEMDGRLRSTSERILASVEDGGNQAAVRLNDAMLRVGDAVANSVETITNRVGQADARIAATVEQGSKLIVDSLETAVVRIDGSISGGAQALFHDLEGATARIEETLSGGSQRIEDRLDVAIARIDGSIIGGSEAMFRNLESASTRIEESLSGGSQRIEDRLDVAISRLDGSIAGRSEAMFRNLESASTRIEDSLSGGTQALSHRLESVIERIDGTIHGGAEIIASRIDAAGERIEDAVCNRGGQIASQISDTAQRLTQAVSVDGAALAEMLTTTTQRIGSVLTESTQQAKDLFEAAGDDMASRLSLHQGVVQLQIETHTADLHTRFTTTATEAISAIGMHGDRINESLLERLNEFESSVLTHGNELTSQIAAHANAFTGTVNDKLAAVEDAFTTHAQAFTDRLADRATEAASTLETSARNFDATAANRTRDLSQSFERQVEAFSATADARATRLEQTIETYIGVFSGAVETRSREMSDLLAENTAAFNASAGARISEISNTVSQGVRVFDDTANMRVEELTQTLMSLVGRIDTGLESRMNAMTETLARQALESARVLNDSADQVKNVLDPTVIEATLLARVRDINDAFSARSQELLDNLLKGAKAVDAALDADAMGAALSSKIAELDTTLESRANEMLQTLNGALARVQGALDPELVERAMAARIDEINESLGDRNRELLQSLLKGARAVETALDSRAIEAMMASRVTEIDATISTRGRELTDNLGERTAELRTIIDQQGPALIELLTTRGGEISRGVSQAVDRIVNTMGVGGEVVMADLSERQKSLTTAIEASAEALRTAIETSASGSVQSLIGVNDRMRGEIVAVLNNLTRTNDSLQSVIEQAGGNLGAVEQSLSYRVSEFRDALEAISLQVTTIGQTTDGAISNAGALSATLERQSVDLAEAATTMAHTQLQLDSTLETRQKSLETLISDVHTRTETFDAIMRAFSSMVEDSFINAEKRSRDIGLFLATETRNVAGVIGQQYDEVRAAAKSEREHTALVLQETYEQATSELAQVFNPVLRQFGEAVSEMRHMSDEVRRELEFTREELRRGSIELPREASEQTAAMRRVVGDQVKALNELTEIVARSGAAYDTSSTSRRSAEPMRRKQEELVRTDSAQQAARALEPRVEPRRTVATPAPAPQQARESAPPAKAAKPADDRGGWLSDLLARASADEPAPQRTAPAVAAPVQNRQPRPADAISGYAREIDRLLSNDSAVGLWDRYYRGDQNVFSRRIYTPAGQQAFEDVRRRYRADTEFHGAVDRYAEEFERALQEVGREDRDGSKVRSYLTSEMGKVYTLLAHAADRFEAA